MTPPTAIRILFVCMGNICRSPAGECVLRHHAEAQGIATSLEIDSAGTIGLHQGHSPDSRMREAGAARGIAIRGSARQVKPADLEHFDLVLAADHENLADLVTLPGADQHRHKIHLFGALTGLGTNTPIPDPYYGGAEGFETVLDLLETGCKELLRRIEAGEIRQGR
jgi:protein-tyrosine phosphatase